MNKVLKTCISWFNALIFLIGFTGWLTVSVFIDLLYPLTYSLNKVIRYFEGKFNEYKIRKAMNKGFKDS